MTPFCDLWLYSKFLLSLNIDAFGGTKVAVSFIICRIFAGDPQNILAFLSAAQTRNLMPFSYLLVGTCTCGVATGQTSGRQWVEGGKPTPTAHRQWAPHR
jgi:hypothetical protein